VTEGEPDQNECRRVTTEYVRDYELKLVLRYRINVRIRGQVVPISQEFNSPSVQARNEKVRLITLERPPGIDDLRIPRITLC
jgi:hypothetical protein